MFKRLRSRLLLPLAAIGLAAALGGCVYPYDYGYGYGYPYGYPYAYNYGYYAGPSVGIAVGGWHGWHDGHWYR